MNRKAPTSRPETKAGPKQTVVIGPKREPESETDHNFFGVKEECGHDTTIKIPSGEVPNEKDYCGRHVEVKLTAQQARWLKRLVLNLDHETKRLVCGRVVQNSPDAVRWLIEQYGQTAECATD